MEGLKMKRLKFYIFLIAFFGKIHVSVAAMKFYSSKQFVHLHKNQSINSIVLQTISCGQVVKVEKKTKKWLKVKSGRFSGFVLKRNMSKKSPECFSEVHSKIYNNIDLDMREIYKLGRLEDLYIYGEPKL
tara:strand:+ start:599 stop:988 length:390 start_codon:yes stop_codon:yes gene_type:complete